MADDLTPSEGPVEPEPVQRRVSQKHPSFVGPLPQYTGVFAEHRVSHKGPLPPIEYMEGMVGVIPDGPERLLRLVEQNAQHRHEMEKKELQITESYYSREQTRSSRGLLAGFVIAFTLLGISGWLINGGHQVSGTILGTLDVARPCRSVCVWEASNKQKQIVEKEKNK